MNNMTKIENRITEIDTFFENNRDFTKFDSSKLHNERSELKFKRNKENINIRLSCANKYYYASQCYAFTKHVMKHGFNHSSSRIDIKSIQKEGISFNKYSINVGFQYGTDLKRFNSTQEMLGFVIGYNTANNI
tara:strand:+ start:184 stop:582 length:399 start_codon:yes stop_codon:yes gene_type:complete